MDPHKTAAMLARGGWDLGKGNVTAQLKAVNARMMTSDVVTTTVQVDDRAPVLTG